jgi:hypothetical protein
MWKPIKQQMVHFKIPFWSICIIIPWLKCILTKFLRPIMPKFYHVWPYRGCLLYNSSNLPNLLIIFPNFLYITSDVAWINTSFNYKPPPPLPPTPQMCMHTSNWPYECSPFMLCPWQWMHGDPWCNPQHFCCNCAKCWLICGTRTTTCTFFNNVRFL